MELESESSVRNSVHDLSRKRPIPFPSLLLARLSRDAALYLVVQRQETVTCRCGSMKNPIGASRSELC